MDLRAYWNALRKSWLLILALTLLGAVLASGALVLSTPQYANTVEFYISTPISENESAQSNGQFAQNRVSSYVQLLESDRLSQSVAQQTGISAGDVHGTIAATAQASTVLVTATVTDTSAARAAQIATALSTAFPKLVDQLDNSGRGRDVVEVNLTSGPTPSDGPVAPNILLYGVIGVAGGLLLGVIVALIRALLDQSMRTAEEVSDAVGAPAVGSVLADSSLKRSPLIVGAAAMSIRAEEFRQIRTSLKFIDAAHQADVLLVTSALAQEGKSLTSVNLAISLAEDDKRVLLVDADLRRPSAAALLGLEQEIGVTNVLIEQTSLAEAVQPWKPDERLSFLASGHLPPNPAELLGGDKMAKLVAELRGRYDKIIIDSPPVLPVADAAVLATLADGVLFVVRYGKTARGAVRTATQSLTDVGAHIVGGVLNLRKESARTLARYSYYPTRQRRRNSKVSAGNNA